MIIGIVRFHVMRCKHHGMKGAHSLPTVELQSSGRFTCVLQQQQQQLQTPPTKPLACSTSTTAKLVHGVSYTANRSFTKLDQIEMVTEWDLSDRTSRNFPRLRSGIEQ
jgi:hypothetical protein